jgi:hypothetical protein
LIGQPINSNVCWAACYTMLRSWRERKKYGTDMPGMAHQGYALQLTRYDGPTGKGAPFPVGDATLNRYGTTALVLSPAAEIWKVPATVSAV